MKKILLLLLAFTLLSCSGRTKEASKEQQSITLEHKPEESQSLVIPESSTIVTSLDVAEKSISPVWERTVDLLDGEVKELLAFNDHVYILGDQFGVKGYENAYEKYRAGNGESIYSYLDNPIYTKSIDVFVRTFSLNGDGIDFEVIDLGVLDDLFDVSLTNEGILFGVTSSNQTTGGNRVLSAGVVQIDGIHLFQQEFLKNSSFRFVDNFLFVYLKNSSTSTYTTDIYEYKNADFHLLLNKIPNTLYGYKIDNEFWWVSTYPVFHQAHFILNSESIQTINYNFSNSLFDKTQLGTFKHVGGYNYLFGYFGYRDDYTGFYWTAYDHGTNPIFYYIKSDDSILFTNLYVAEDGFFITGQEDGKMLLLFLSPEGEVQWKAHIRDGVLRGIVKQDGRYFVAGDYNVRVSDKEGDWGTDYLYLGEIKID